jgi:hypothetical protein
MARTLGFAFFLHALSVLVSARSVAPPAQAPLVQHSNGTTISTQLFIELEELARVVDIAYCVGTAGLGIQKPFECASRCGEFDHFELVTVSLRSHAPAPSHRD